MTVSIPRVSYPSPLPPAYTGWESRECVSSEAKLHEEHEEGADALCLASFPKLIDHASQASSVERSDGAERGQGAAVAEGSPFGNVNL